MADKGRIYRSGASWRLAGCILIPAAAAVYFAWTAGDGFERIGAAATKTSTVDVAALPSAVRLMQAADGLGGAVSRLVWSESQQSRSAARAAAAAHDAALTGYLTARPDPADPVARQAADAAEKMAALMSKADQIAERRLTALAGLPAARERLVVTLGALDSQLAERRSSLNALQRFHPDTQKELERHEEWRQTSRNLLGALLLTANAADGQSGSAGAAAAHLNRLRDFVAAFPDSDFAQTLRQGQESLTAAVVGPQGALTQLASLREAQDAAQTLSVEIQRAALDLSLSGADYVAAARAGADRRLSDIADDANAQRYDVATGAMAALIMALLAAAYALGGVLGRLRRLKRALRYGDMADVTALAAGGDEIGALAAAAARLRDDADKRQAGLDAAFERIDMAMEAGAAAIWDENLIEGRVWWSPGYYRLLGYDPEELAPTVGLWEMLVHPDDRAAAAESAERCMAGLADTYIATYRMRRKDGDWIWIEDRGRVKRDADGAAVRFVGVMRDASKSRRTEISLRLAKETADAESRARRDMLAATERRLRPSLRRLAARLAQLESWALTDEQRRQVEEVKRDSQSVLDTLAALGQMENGDALRDR